jgi:GMP synthase (glutamine-hydrolysing)
MMSVLPNKHPTTKLIIKGPFVTKNKPRQGILILDFGSQYTQLIARRIREMGVYCEIYSYTLPAVVTHFTVCGVILSGGPASTTAEHSPRAPAWVFTLDCPLLGICYGMQTMAMQHAGLVKAATIHEYGHAQVKLVQNNPLFAGIVAPHELVDVWMSHGDQVVVLPEQFECIASTSDAPIAAMFSPKRQWYGVQFHPEVTHTPCGKQLLANFVLTICHAPALWTTANIIDELIVRIRTQVGHDRVLLALSGGVDSSVVAVLLQRAIGKQLVCVFVDTGLLRLNEAQQVQATFAKNLGIELICVDASTRFYSALAGVACPEEKRKIIGRLFIDVFAEEALQLTAVPWLAQGTIYPDVIESAAVSGSNGSELIKSHHNVAGLPKDMPFKLIEPLRELFKDEVRALGIELGLPHEMVYRHPFPGPGLAVRILGAVTPEFAAQLRQADAIFIESLRQADLYHTVSQAFAVFLPIKSVGVMGDGRRYDYVICLRAVKTDDFMTATWAQFPWDFLANVSNRIINEVPGISRVVYDISGKPPATIEWE